MPELWAVDNAAWRKTKEFHAHDGSAWRKAKEVWVHDGGAWRKTFSGFTPNNPCNISHEAYYGSSTTSTLYFENDGTCTGTRTGYPNLYYTWGTPTPSAGIGDEHWIRATFVNGARYSGYGFGVWYQIKNTGSGVPYWRAATGTATVAWLTANIEIATDSGGTNIVATGQIYVYAEKIV